MTLGLLLYVNVLSYSSFAEALSNPVVDGAEQFAMTTAASLPPTDGGAEEAVIR